MNEFLYKFLDIFYSNAFSFSKIYDIINTERTSLNLQKGENAMYLTVKQQVKHLSKEDYKSIKQLCHIAKNLANQAIFNVRQYYFTEGEFLKYEKYYAFLKSSDNFKMLNSNMAQQIL